MAARYGIRVFGPNTNTNAFEVLPEPPRRRGGRIGLVTQSGHQGRPIVQGTEFGIAFSRWVPTGNELDLEAADFIEYYAYDDDTAVIAGYFEGFRDPPKLRRALEAANAERKPVVALKMGATSAGTRMASSHTGHLAGSDAVVDGLFRQYGVTRVSDLDELLETAALFAKLPAGTGPRLLSLFHLRRFGHPHGRGGRGVRRPRPHPHPEDPRRVAGDDPRLPHRGQSRRQRCPVPRHQSGGGPPAGLRPHRRRPRSRRHRHRAHRGPGPAHRPLRRRHRGLRRRDPQAHRRHLELLQDRREGFHDPHRRRYPHVPVVPQLLRRPAQLRPLPGGLGDLPDPQEDVDQASGRGRRRPGRGRSPRWPPGGRRLAPPARGLRCPPGRGGPGPLGGRGRPPGQVHRLPRGHEDRLARLPPQVRRRSRPPGRGRRPGRPRPSTPSSWPGPQGQPQGPRSRASRSSSRWRAASR